MTLVCVCVRGFPRGAGRGRVCAFRFAASDVVGGKGACVCMHPRLPPLWSERTYLCVCVGSFPHVGGRGRTCVYVEASVALPTVRGEGAHRCRWGRRSFSKREGRSSRRWLPVKAWACPPPEREARLHQAGGMPRQEPVSMESGLGPSWRICVGRGSSGCGGVDVAFLFF